jgi:hypothetical protein
MKEERKHSIDKLFHESLGGHKIEPSEGVWSSLSASIPKGSGRGALLFLLTALAIGAFSIFLNTQLHSGQEIAAQSNNTESTPIENTEIASVNNDQSINILEHPSEPETEINSTASSLEKDSTLPPISDESTAIPANEPSPTKAVDKDDPVQSEGLQNSQDVSSKHYRLDLLDYRIALIELDEPLDIPKEETRKSQNPIFDLTIKDGYVKKADILFGVGFSPAVNIYPDGQNRNDYSLELIAAYEKSRFLVEGGIGGNYTTESAKYGINYSSYDSIGYYVNVNSFIFDPGNPDSVRFETSLKSIYDSIDHYRVKENTNKFAYLQIPLRIGYRVIEKNRFSMDLKVGILFSLQVYKDVPDVPYQGNDGDQIEVIRHYPDRLTTNWQYTAGIGMNYHINNQLRFTLEPFYRQYIKSVYSTSSEYSARSPYAFGIRGGIYFHF